jgi:hypothetical protein
MILKSKLIIFWSIQAVLIVFIMVGLMIHFYQPSLITIDGEPHTFDTPTEKEIVMSEQKSKNIVTPYVPYVPKLLSAQDILSHIYPCEARIQNHYLHDRDANQNIIARSHNIFEYYETDYTRIRDICVNDDTVYFIVSNPKLEGKTPYDPSVRKVVMLGSSDIYFENIEVDIVKIDENYNDGPTHTECHFFVISNDEQILYTCIGNGDGWSEQGWYVFEVQDALNVKVKEKRVENGEIVSDEVLDIRYLELFSNIN